MFCFLTTLSRLQGVISIIALIRFGMIAIGPRHFKYRRETSMFSCPEYDILSY
jgi:hypothetical protein